jgi:serine/tyrosine/threonine adenylyltransferase
VSLAVGSIFRLDHTFVRDLEGLYEPWHAATVPSPKLLVLNEALATALDLDVDRLRSPEGVALLVGNDTTPGSSPVAQAYSGHQFGGFSPRLDEKIQVVRCARLVVVGGEGA